MEIAGVLGNPHTTAFIGNRQCHCGNYHCTRDCEIMQSFEINPIPLLIAEAILSNTGGVASMVGDPPNVMIATAAGIPEIAGLFGFIGFLLRLGFISFWLGLQHWPTCGGITGIGPNQFQPMLSH